MLCGRKREAALGKVDGAVAARKAVDPTKGTAMDFLKVGDVKYLILAQLIQQALLG